MTLELRGVFPANLTPFNEDFSIDEEGLRSHIRDLIGVKGVAGIVTNGHAGEVTSLTREEQQRVISIVGEEVNNKVPIISGVIHESTAGAIQMAKDAKNEGADAILLFPPNVFAGGGTADDEHPFNFVAAIADAVDIPIVVFQLPVSRLGYTTETLVRMVEEIPSVIGFKEGSDDLKRYEENLRALRACSRRTSILTTNNTWLFSSLAIGGDGILSGAGSVISDLLVELWEAVEDGDLHRARKVNDRIFPITQVFYKQPLMNMHNRMKVALQLLGRQKKAIPRPPLLPIKQEERDKIEQALKLGGLL